MPTPNPEYDPNCEIVCDYHRKKYDLYHKERVRINEARYDLTRRRVPFESEQSQALEKAREQIDAKMKVHLAARLESFRSQFPTIQEFAALRFDYFNQPADPGAKAPVVDLEQFTTIDQVIDAWNRQAEARDAAEARKNYRIPPGSLEPC
jgi:Na+-translocating ferredoxin:NAD+ oxidoreductase RnfC subunit